MTNIKPIINSNSFEVFNHPTFGTVRIVMKDGEPWFVGKDVAQAFNDTNYRRSLSRLSSDEKGVSQIDTLGGKQKMIIINESGLYSLLFYMQPQKAKGVSQNNALIEERISKLKKFRRWVTSEVLPNIRKHGIYLTKEKLEEMLLDPDVVLELATKLKEDRSIKQNTF